MTSSKPQYERITVEDVAVGDHIARTRTDTFYPVESIDEGPGTRRLHFARVACPRIEFSGTSVLGIDKGRRYCSVCHRWEADGHGLAGGGNIRPRRTAKLWRVVVSAVDPELTPAEVAEQERQEWAG